MTSWWHPKIIKNKIVVMLSRCNYSLIVTQQEGSEDSRQGTNWQFDKWNKNRLTASFPLLTNLLTCMMRKKLGTKRWRKKWNKQDRKLNKTIIQISKERKNYDPIKLQFKNKKKKNYNKKSKISLHIQNTKIRI